MLRSLLVLPTLPAVYLASSAYWLVMSRIVEQRLRIYRR